MACVKVSAISNNGSIKEYLEIQKMPASCVTPAYGASKVGNCVREDITPKHVFTYIIIIANIIF